MGFGIDGPVIANGVDFVAFPSNFGDSITLGLLKLFNELVHDIKEDNLQDVVSAKGLCDRLQEKGKWEINLPRSQTDTASQQQSLGQCSHPQNVQP